MGSGWGGSDDDVRTGTVSAGRERVPVAMPSPKSSSASVVEIVDVHGGERATVVSLSVNPG